MKLFLLAILLILQYSCFAQHFRKYPFETGIIEYKLEGYSKGKQITYWKNFGYNELTIVEQETELLGQKSFYKKTILVLGDFIYQWILNDKYLHKLLNPDVEIWQQGKFASTEWENFFERCMYLQGYEKMGSEKIRNKACQRYDGLQKRWYWNGLLIKMESTLLNNKLLMQAEKIKTNIDISPSLFDPPVEKTLIDNTQQKVQIQFDTIDEYNPSKLKGNLDNLFKKE